eukprot:CAMPEP_0170560172 /NCGR_PEP_ID=MMETSP0211-20121228/47284_1 /TAXON_ID=311385 /ORGANISM="Pseudokeronopsis sp., Strain OXSARD2" /LENGTH=203 /DNA_ID=CAMNT_0010874025 /DNA_START=30 /DNA_END=641 /DNA_ORIENTATION=-
MLSCIVQCLILLYVGSIRSIKLYSFNTIISGKKSDNEGEEKLVKSENSLISLKTALTIPVMATLSLVAVYFIIKNDLKILNKICYGYIVCLGTLSLKKYLYEYLRTSANLARFDYAINLPLRLLRIHLTMLELFVLILCCYFSFLYVQSNFWLANNIFAYCFTIYAIESWLVGSFRNIVIVFLGLVLYDIYFVFGTEVMATVA